MYHPCIKLYNFMACECDILIINSLYSSVHCGPRYRSSLVHVKIMHYIKHVWYRSWMATDQLDQLVLKPQH